MKELTIHRNPRTNATVISNRFIDEYMLKANGEFVKIYLYLLRCMNSDSGGVSISTIADRFEHTEKDVKRALSYWEKLNLLRLEYNGGQELTGVYFLDMPAGSDEEYSSIPSIIEDNAAEVPAPERTVISRSRKRELQEKADIKQLLFVAEQYLGKTLSSADIDKIFYFYDKLEFSADLIEYLIEYCVSKGVKSMHYMDKVAAAWKEAAITTVSDAKACTNTYNKNCFSVLKAFGIRGRNPAESELEYITRWTEEFGFELDIILEACSRTIKALHQPNFSYADKILETWKKQEVRHLNDIKQLDEEYQKAREFEKKTIQPEITSPSSKNKFNNFEQRNYDYDELEKALLDAQKAN